MKLPIALTILWNESEAALDATGHIPLSDALPVDENVPCRF